MNQQTQEKCSSTKKLIEDMEESVRTMIGADFSSKVKAMDNAVHVLQGELVRHKNEAEFQKKALFDAKRNWNIYVKEKGELGEEINGLELEARQMPLLATEGLTINFGFPKSWSQYSDGQAISSLISSNPQSMTHLYLELNRLDDDDILHVASSLQSNTNLRVLVLDGSEISTVMEQALLGAVYNISKESLRFFLKTWHGHCTRAGYHLCLIQYYMS